MASKEDVETAIYDVVGAIKKDVLNIETRLVNSEIRIEKMD